MDEPTRLNEFEEILLLVVARLGGDAHGVLMRQALKEVARRTVSVGTIYASLDRLESRGMVSQRPGAPSSERGGRAATYYTIAEEGERALREADETRARLRTRLRPGWEPAGEVDGRSS
jgi:DNA-binding PadR family transcriptional regulator